jgi:hypothetical protein
VISDRFPFPGAAPSAKDAKTLPEEEKGKGRKHEEDAADAKSHRPDIRDRQQR